MLRNWQLTVRYEDGTTGLAEDTAFKTSIIQTGEEENSESEELNTDENTNAEADTPLWLLEAIDELGSEQLNGLENTLEQNSQQQTTEYLASNEIEPTNNFFNADINLDDHSGIESWVEPVADQNQLMRSTRRWA